MEKQGKLNLGSGDVEFVSDKVVHHIDLRVSPTFLEMFNELKERYEREYGRKLSKSEVMRICVNKTMIAHGLEVGSEE